MNNISFKPICELGKVVTGKTPSTEDESNFSTDFPFITPSDIHTFNEKKLCGTERGISLSAAKKMAKNILPADSVCFVCIGSTIGKMCMTTTNSFTNQQINTLIVNKENNPHYIFYLLRYIKGYFQLLGSGTGSGKGIVNKSTFEKTKIPVVCDIDIQNRIADILSTYDDLIENNNRRIALLEKAAQELYKEWFVRFRFPGYENAKFKNGLPEGWKDGTLGEIAFFKRGKTITKDQTGEGMVPVVAGGLEPAYYHNQSNTASPVITVSGSGANAGFTRMYHTEVWASDCSFVDAQNTDNIYFAYCVLKNKKSDIDSLQKGAAQPHVYAKDINALEILVPDSLCLAEFENLVTPLFEKIKSLYQQIELSKEARDRLLPKLMSGELEV